MLTQSWDKFYESIGGATSLRIEEYEDEYSPKAARETTLHIIIILYNN